MFRRPLIPIDSYGHWFKVLRIETNDGYDKIMCLCSSQHYLTSIVAQENTHHSSSLWDEHHEPSLGTCWFFAWVISWAAECYACSYCKPHAKAQEVNNYALWKFMDKKLTDPMLPWARNQAKSVMNSFVINALLWISNE